MENGPFMMIYTLDTFMLQVKRSLVIIVRIKINLRQKLALVRQLKLLLISKQINVLLNLQMTRFQIYWGSIMYGKDSHAIPAAFMPTYTEKSHA